MRESKLFSSTLMWTGLKSYQPRILWTLSPKLGGRSLSRIWRRYSKRMISMMMALLTKMSSSQYFKFETLTNIVCQNSSCANIFIWLIIKIIIKRFLVDQKMDSIPSKTQEEQKVAQDVDPVVSEPSVVKVVKKDKGPARIYNKVDLYTEILKQNTYTDIVDAILKYLKSVKGSPEELVNTLDYIKGRIVEQI